MRNSLTILFLLVFLISGFVASSLAEVLSAKEKSRIIEAEEFLSSPAGMYFRNGQYEQALGELEALMQKYPGDQLVRRYFAMTLDRVGRSAEAAGIFENMISEDPQHIPTRYFLAHAYFNLGWQAAATREWQWVIQSGKGTPYEEWARTALKGMPAPGGG